MASIASRIMRTKQQLERAQKRIKDIDAHIGQLMSKRVDYEEYMAERYKELEHLEKLKQTLPTG